MGVTGLLPFLKKCTRKVNIKEFEGYTVAVDAYCWIHRASYSCAMDLALGNPTSQYVNYCLKYLKMILNAGVRPILVFDGANLPAKSETEFKRRKSKKIYREKAAQYLLEGNRRAAQECFERCVEVTQNMAREVIKAARDLGVDCVVAPYESDAQLAYLIQAGYADLVITEDSDLLMFGCKQVIFKLDMSGCGCLITWSAGIGEQCCGMSSQDFTPTHLRFMGILSGCDYFPGIPRIGLATAAKIIRQCRTSDFRYLLSNIGSFCNLTDAACQPIGSLQDEPLSQSSNYSGDQISLSPSSSISTSSSILYSSARKNVSFSRQKPGGNKLHEDTVRAAMRAERTFRLQVVFDPKSRRRLRLSEPTMEDVMEERLIRADVDQSNSDLFTYAGVVSVDSGLALAIALGNANFDTGEIIDSFNPNDFKVKKLFNILKSRSEPTLETSPGSVGSVLKRVRRPDGDRLNTSFWSPSYKLEPVWLYYVDNGIQTRPLCLSIEDGVLNVSQLINPEDREKRIRPPTRSPLHLPTGVSLNRSRRVTVAPVLTAEPAITSLTRKRPLTDDSEPDLDYIQDVVNSYISEEKPILSKTPLRDFSSSKTPVTSASMYFSSPVSKLILPRERSKSPALHCKRSRSLLAEVNVVPRGNRRTALSEHKPTSYDQTEGAGVKLIVEAPLGQRFSCAPLKCSKRDTSEWKLQHQADSGCTENEHPVSPIFDENHLSPEPIRNAKRDLPSLFSRWQFSPPERSSSA